MWNLARTLGCAVIAAIAARALATTGSTPSDVVDHELDERWIATIDGEGLPRKEFASWLVQRVGRQYVHEYVELKLLRDRAKELGVTLDPEEFDAHFQELWRRKILGKYRNEEALLVHIKGLGYSKDDYRWEKALDWEKEQLWQSLVLSRRSVTEEELLEMHRNRWGEESERWRIQIAFFDLGQRRLPGDDGNPDVTELKRRAADARRRSEEFTARLANSSDFALLVKDLGDRLPEQAASLARPSEDPYNLGGEIADYPRGLLEAAVETALAPLEPGATTEVVEGRKGLYIVHMIDRTPLSLEDTRVLLQAERTQAPPTPAERQQAREALWRAAEVTRRY